MTKILKKNSSAWQMAKRYERLKYAIHCQALGLSKCGGIVTFQALGRGNLFKRNEREIADMIRRAKESTK